VKTLIAAPKLSLCVFGIQQPEPATGVIPLRRSLNAVQPSKSRNQVHSRVKTRFMCTATTIVLALAIAACGDGEKSAEAEVSSAVAMESAPVQLPSQPLATGASPVNQPAHSPSTVLALAAAPTVAATPSPALPSTPSPDTPIPLASFDKVAQITIGESPRQRFIAFGTSQSGRVNDGYRINYLMGFDPVRRDQMLDMVYRDLGVDVLRLWLPYSETASLEALKTNFYAGYLDNGMLAAIQSRGPKTLLLAPARGETAPSETMQSYATRVAQFISDVFAERGVKIAVTGIANEPAGFTPQQLADAARLLRSELDSRGLQDVGIVGPEWASADSHLLRALDAMKADAQAWAALRGIASHSYNMGATKAVVSRIADTDKEYWQTEAGKQTLVRGTDEQPGNDSEAATVAARFLSDMNHLVTHWFWFIGVNVYDPHPFGDAGQELVRPDNSTGLLKVSTKYHYLKQLVGQTFDRGAVFRSATSLSEGDMVWTYGQKPSITAAVAQNPDGTWAIGIANTTGVESNSSLSRYYAPATYKVVIKLPERTNGTFTVLRSSATRSLAREPNLVAQDGELTAIVGARELVTLRATSP